MVDIWLTPSPLLVNVVYECPLKERTKSIGVIHKPCGQKGEGFIENSTPQNVKKHCLDNHVVYVWPLGQVNIIIPCPFVFAQLKTI